MADFLAGDFLAGDFDVGDVTAPTLTSATIDSTGLLLTLVFDEPITGAEPTGDGITLDASGGVVTITAASGDGTDTIECTLDRAIETGETVTLDYSGGSIVDAAANPLADIVDAAVTNNSEETGTTSPVPVMMAQYRQRWK